MARHTLTAFSILIVVLLTPAFASAAEPRVSTSVEPGVVSVGGTVRFVVKATVDGNKAIQLVERPNFGSAFRTIGTSQAPSMVARNRNVQRSLRLTFRLQARKTGKHELAPPKLRIGGKEVVGPTQTVEVVPSGEESDRDENRGSTGDDKLRLGYEIEPTKRPYLGQQVTVSYHLLTDPHRVRARPEPPNEPSLDAFWIEDLSRKLAGRSKMTTVNGRMMKQMTLRSYALFPLESGAVTVEPMGVTVRTDGGILRGDKRVDLRSDPIDLQVRPLPDGAPDGFYEGNVGTWSFRVERERRRGKVGSAMMIRLIASGTGNVRRLELPKLDDIDGWRVADRDEEVEKRLSGTSVSGQKTVEVSLVPTREGELTLPPLEFSYFDPNRETYRTIESDPMTFRIEPGQFDRTDAGGGQRRAADQTSDTDERTELLNGLNGPIRRLEDVHGRATTVEKTIFGVAAGVPLLGLIGLLLGPRLRRSLGRDDPRRERKAAADKARALLDEASELAADEATDRLYAAIRTYVTGALDVPAGDVASTDIGEHLERAGVAEGDRQSVLTLLSWCEQHRYAPVSKIDDAELATMIRDAADVIDAMEEQRRSGRATPVHAALVLTAFMFAAVMPVSLLAASEPDIGPALEAQDAQKWQTAAEKWERLLDQRPDDPALLHNLGTSLAHDGKLDRARLALEHAALQAPGHRRIAENLQAVRRLVELDRLDQARGPTGGAILEPGLTWWKTATAVSSRSLAVGLTLSLWVLLFGVVGLRRADDATYRNIAITTTIVALVALTGIGGFWGARWQATRSVQPAVVAETTATVRQAPSRHAAKEKPSLPLVPGTMVRVVEEREGWSKVRLVGGETGWVSSDRLSGLEP